MTAQDEIKELLLSADLDIEGVLPDASNLTARVLLSGTAERALYKPIQGEAPLRDFPDGTLAGREVAAYQVSALGGWDLIPQTVLRDGPLGPGSVQRWIDWEATGSAPGDGMLEAFAATGVPEGWLPIVHGEDQDGRPVVVAHRDSPDLASLAVLDLVLNNADRKGAHLIRDASGRIWGVDHGLTLHVQDKLRTVLWGWAGQPLPDRDRERLAQLHDALRPADTRDALDPAGALDALDPAGAIDALDPAGAIDALISPEELTALIARVEALRTHPVFPDLPPDRYPLPWPLW